MWVQVGLVSAEGPRGGASPPPGRARSGAERGCRIEFDPTSGVPLAVARGCSWARLALQESCRGAAGPTGIL